MPVEAKKDTRRVTPDPLGPPTIVEGNVGILDVTDTRINPAEEDGNLATIKTNTDNLDITTSALRDAILGAGTKDFSTIQTVLDSIKDTDGIKKITDTVTVAGTVTANAGTNLNTSALATHAKQDTIIGHIDQIEGYVDGIEGLLTTIDADTSKIPDDPAREGGNLAGILARLDIALSSLRDALRGVSPNHWKADDNQSTAQTNKQLRAAPGAGLSLYITDITMSTDTAMNIKLVEDTAGVPADVWKPMYFAANGGLVTNLKTPIKVTANKDLGYTSSAAGNHSLVICGFIAP